MSENGSNSDNQGNGKKPGGSAQPPRMKMSRNVMSWLGFVLVALMITMIVQQQYHPPQPLTFSDFKARLRDDRIAEVVVSDDNISGKFKENVQGDPIDQRGKQQFRVEIRVNDPTEYADKLSEQYQGLTIRYESSNRPFITLLIQFIPWLLLIAFFWFFVIRQLRASAGGAGMLGNFGRSRHRVSSKEVANVTFKDVAGIDEAKDELKEIVEFLKHPKKFQRLGGRIPRGVLLVGSPGCGKTLLAKAIAGEADVPFFSISGADFVEMFVGVGASRVRDLFKSAKENAPCIIFLDEVDAVGRKRGAAYNGGGHDEREQTLNAILVEMDGFDTSDQVIVIAATNRDDILDPALTRPGRFDRKVIVAMPDIKGRLEILKVHAKKIKLAPTVDLMRVARGTPTFSGAELAAIVNEAAIMATMQNKDMVEQGDLEEARDKIRFGRSNKSRAVEEKERLATAYHEAGHAVIQTLLKDADPLHKVTIIPRGMALGATMSLPEKDRYGYGMRWLRATLRVLCGGRIAEEKHCGDVSSGAAMDIQQATAMARAMVLEWGMSDKLGFVRYTADPEHESFFATKPYSDETAHLIDEEVRRMIEEAYADAGKLLNQNWAKVEAVADALMKHETLDAEEVRRLCLGETLDKPSLSGLLADEHASDARRSAAIQAPPPPRPDLPGGGLPTPHPGLG